MSRIMHSQTHESTGNTMRSQPYNRNSDIRRNATIRKILAGTNTPTHAQVKQYEELCSQLSIVPSEFFYKHGPIFADGLINTMKRHIELDQYGESHDV